MDVRGAHILVVTGDPSVGAEALLELRARGADAAALPTIAAAAVTTVVRFDLVVFFDACPSFEASRPQLAALLDAKRPMLLVTDRGDVADRGRGIGLRVAPRAAWMSALVSALGAGDSLPELPFTD